MTNTLAKWFIKDHENVEDVRVRENYGRLASVVGILSNILLFGLKFFVGLFSHSIAIMVDAVNSLMDSASSLITLVGFILSGRPADKEHPYGHARTEYISSLFVALIIVFVGLEFFQSSVEKIKNPNSTFLSVPLLIILVVSIIVKIWQGFFNKKIGKQIDSQALEATAKDSFNDVIITSVVLVSALVEKFFGYQIDGWAGAAIAVYVIISGISMVFETIDSLLGKAPSKEMVQEVEEKIMSYEGIRGYHDLLIHDYGPRQKFASVHVEVSQEQDILVSHEIIDTMERDFREELSIELVIHMDPISTDEKTVQLGEEILSIIQKLDSELEMHDFRIVEGKSHTNLIFDLFVPFSYPANAFEGLREQIQKTIRETYSDYHCIMNISHNVTGEGV